MTALQKTNTKMARDGHAYTKTRTRSQDDFKSSEPSLRSLAVRPLFIASIAAAAALSGCQCGHKAEGPGASPSVNASLSASAAAPPKVRRPADVLQGSVIARSLAGDTLFIAEEDRKSLRVMPIPKEPDPAKASASASAAPPALSEASSAPVASASAAPSLSASAQAQASAPPMEEPVDIGFSVPLPGAPAQLVALDGLLLLTIRDPALLLVLEQDETTGKFKEKGRVALPVDAWGLSVSPDEKTALVSSAWAHQVSAVDLDSLKVRFSVDVAREPRGIAITEDGSRAYISHLVGSKLTRIKDIKGDKPEAVQVELPPSPLRAPTHMNLSASLGYSLTLSPDGKRLYAARHALGARGSLLWFGAPTVDVLLTRDDTPLSPKVKTTKSVYLRQGTGSDEETGGLLSETEAWVQPRAIVYRKRSKTLLVVSEGNAVMAELDAYAIDPSAIGTKKYYLTHDSKEPKKPKRCEGGSGIALSKDETKGFVYCRVSSSIVALDLSGDGSLGTSRYIWELPNAGADKELEEGRRFFYTADDSDISGGLGCAACHPEGRDDGFVWTEVTGESGHKIFLGDIEQNTVEFDAKCRRRQTPMLAGRVKSKGPYGWRAQNESLQERVLEGFGMHRWFNEWAGDVEAKKRKAKPLGYFVQNGLVAPPRKSMDALSPEEQKGKEIFMSEQTGCIRCHAGEEYSDRVAVALGPWEKAEGFEDESADTFKTPSLLYVGGTAPYYHDGSVKTLEELIEKNNDRMGKTKHLSKEEKAALVAFLRVL